MKSFGMTVSAPVFDVDRFVSVERGRVLGVFDAKGVQDASRMLANECERAARDSALALTDGVLRTRNASALLEQQLIEAARRAAREVERKPSWRGVGASVLLCAVVDDRLVTAHAGSTRLYCSSDEGWRQVTRDDTLGQEILESGIVSREEAALHPMRRSITRKLAPDHTLQLNTSVTGLPRHARVLLVTDGAIDSIEPHVLDSAFSEASPRAAVERILSGRTFHDHATVLAADV